MNMAFFVARLFVVVILVSLDIYYGAALLQGGKFTGVEFISWSALVFSAGFVLIFFSKIQELSVGGWLIKLNHAKEQTENLLAEIKQTKLELYSVLLDGVLVTDGGFYLAGCKEPAVDRFWNIWEKITRSGLERQLASQARGILVILGRLQLIRVTICGTNVTQFDPKSENYSGSDDPEWLAEPWRLDSVAYAAFAEKSDKNNGLKVEMLAEQLQAYRKLYEVYEQLKVAAA